MLSDDSLDLDQFPTPVLLLRAGIVVAASPSAVAVLRGAGSGVVGRPLGDLVAGADRAANERLTRLDAAGREPGSGASTQGEVVGGGRRRDDVAPVALAPGSLGADPDEIVVRVGSDPQRPAILTLGGEHRGGRLVGVRDLTLERRLAAIIDAVADSTLLLDPDGQLLWQSDRLASRAPAGAANLGSHPVERLHPEDLPLVLEGFAELARRPSGRLSRVVRSRAVERDDIWQLIELIGASRVDDPDLGGVVVQVRNLDEGAQLDSLGQTDGPMLSLAEAAPVGILLMNRAGRVVYASQMGRDLLGYGPTGDLSEWRERIAPAHRGVIDALVAGGMAGAEAATITAPVLEAATSTRWMRIRVAPHRDGSAEILGAIAAFEDVTVEVEARAESERLIHMLDVTSDFVVLFRPTGEILHANAAVRQVLDRLRAEGGEGRLADLLGADERDRLLLEALSPVPAPDTWHGETLLNVGGGVQMPVSVIGVIRRDHAGQLDWFAIMARDISEVKAAEGRLRQIATSDHLTGLANRSLFTEHLDQVVARSRRSGRAMAVLFCDLDRFKEVNDRYGHGAGDSVLMVIAERLREITREGDMAARVGGDEFVVLCEGVTDADDLAALAERVIASVHRPIDIGGRQVQVGISIGVAVARRPGVDGDRLLILADQAMYRAKATGGSRYRIMELDQS